VPRPLSGAAPAFFFGPQTRYFPFLLARKEFSPPRVRILASRLHLAVTRYLCAACTFGQAISTVPVGEDGCCPAEHGLWGYANRAEKDSRATKSNALRSAMAREFVLRECDGDVNGRAKKAGGTISNGPGNKCI